MIPFNYHHLYYFYVIAQEGSIAKATKQLRLAQPTLSAQLKQFESFLGTTLFIRDKRGLTLTDEGHQVLAYAKMIFDIGQELKEKMDDFSANVRPRINIGVNNFAPKTIIDLLMHFVLQRSPDTHIHLEKNTMPNLIQKLDNHSLDIVMTDSPFEATLGQAFYNKFIGKIPIVFCAHPKVAKKVSRFPDDLNHHPLILPSAPSQIAYALKEFFYENHIEPNVIAEMEDIETIRRMTLRGYGISALNMLTIKEAPAKQKLAVLNEDKPTGIEEKIYLIIKKRKQKHPVVETILHDFELEKFD